MRTVIIGCGQYCRYVLPGIQSHQAFHIVAIADPKEDNRREVGKMVGLSENRQFASVARAFDEVEADFAFVFSNVEAHAENCRAALEARCCVAVAKPFVNNLPEGLKLTELARTRGLWISVWQSYRLSPQAQAMKQLIKKGALGTPAFGNMYGYRDRMQNLADYQLHESWPAINATSIHEFDLLRYLFDANVVKVRFRGIEVEWNPYDDPGVVTGWLQMDNGLVVSYFHSFVSRVYRGPEHPYYHGMIQGSKGALFWGGPWWSGDVEFHNAEKQTVEKLPLADKDERAQVWDYCQWLYESLYEARPVFAEGTDNLWSLAAIKASELSAQRNGDIVGVQDFGRELGLCPP